MADIVLKDTDGQDIIVTPSTPVEVDLENSISTDIDLINSGQGLPGAPGVGVPTGGTAGQVLAKIDSSNYNTEWVNQSGGGAVSSVNGQTGVVVISKSDVGLGNVDNTSDINKPISTATQTALNAKYDASNPSNYITSAGAPVQSVAGKTGTVTLVKGDVGLGNVDNTSDATKNSASATLTNKDLTSGTNTFPTFNQNTTGSAATLTTPRTIGTLTGDVTSAGSTFNGSANNTNATTLATVNSNVGSFGSATQVGTFTVNAKGLTTAAGSTSIQIAESQVTNLVSDLAGKEPAFSKGNLIQGTNVTLTGTLTNRLVGTGDVTISATGGGGGGISRAVITTSGNYGLGSASSTDYVYLVSGNHTGTLPAASGAQNRYTVKNNHTTNVTVQRGGSDTIDGATSISIAPQASVDLINNGSTSWNVI